MAIPSDWLCIEPDLYAENGNLHLFTCEFLRNHGIPDNEHNRRMVEEALKAPEISSKDGKLPGFV